MTDTRVISLGELKTLIGVAFPVEPVPGKMDIVYDNTGRHHDCEEVRRTFGDSPWIAIPHSVITHNPQGLFFFNMSGYKYYLPAFIMTVANDPRNTGDVLHCILSSLTVGSSKSGGKTAARVTPFVKEQVRALRAFFRWLRETAAEVIDTDDLEEVEKGLQRVYGDT